MVDNNNNINSEKRSTLNATYIDEIFNATNDDLSQDQITSSSDNITDIAIRNKVESVYEHLIFEVKNDPVLQIHKSKIDLIYKTLRNALENEDKFLNRLENAKFLHDELLKKYNKAIKLSYVDQQTIAQLKIQIENAWRVAHVATEKEKRTRETVNGMKLEISNLSKLVEQGVGLTMGQEYNMHEIIGDNEKLKEEIERHKETIESLENEVKKHKKSDESFTKFIEEISNEKSKVQKELTTTKVELEQNYRTIERLTEQVNSLEKHCQLKEENVEKLNKFVQSQEISITHTEDKIREVQDNYDKALKEIESYANRLQKTNQEHSHTLLNFDALQAQNHSLNQRIQFLEQNVSNLKLEIEQGNKNKQALENKLVLSEENIKELNNQKSALNSQIESFKKELDSCSRGRKLDSQQTECVKREKNQLDKHVKKLYIETQKQKSAIKLHENNDKSLKNENEVLKREILSLKENLVKSEKENKKHLNNVNELSIRIVKLVQELKLKELEYSEYEKRIRETESKMSQTHKLYEAVRSDRNMNAKSLMETEEQMDDMKKQLIMCKNQEDHYVKVKIQLEKELTKLKSEYIKMEKSRNHIQSELDTARKQLQISRQVTDNLNREQKQSLKSINELDNENRKFNKDIEKLRIERCVFGSQLVRRNDEIGLLYEKIKLLEITLNRGETMYAERLRDIKILRVEVKRLQNENRILKCDGNVILINQLRNELHLCERELLSEKAKRNVLEDNKMSLVVHRWRKLRECDPTNYELIIKIQSLQKRLIKKYSEVAELRLKFEQKEFAFEQLKIHLAKNLVSQNPQDIFNKYQADITNKTRKLKSVLAEYNMMVKENSEFKEIIDSQRNEIKNCKFMLANCMKNQNV